MKIIINADDLGATTEVNDAIFELMAARRITSATVLANGAAVEDAARRLKHFPSCSFGIHLNASEFRPVGSDSGLRPILDDNGCFAGNRVRQIPVGAAIRAAILEEWSAQIERLLALGVPLSHFDSHHHVHTVPRLFPVVKRLQSRFGVRKVRLTMNVYPPEAQPTRRLVLAKAAWNFALRHWAVRTVTAERFTSFEVFTRAAAQLRGLHSIELMVHPGSARHETETHLLLTDWMKDLPFAAHLISYDEL